MNDEYGTKCMMNITQNVWWM